MKKILAVAAILMLVPFTAFGMQMMADTALDDVTGQAGVSISIDNVQMDMSIEYLSWGDGDGLGGSAAGYVNMNTIRMTGIIIDKLLIGAAGLPAITGNLYAYDSDPGVLDVTTTALTAATLQALTIDVGGYALAGGKTAVKIGVPTLSIYVDKIDDITLSLGTSANAVVAETDILGTISMGAIQLDTKGGAVYILAH